MRQKQSPPEPIFSTKEGSWAHSTVAVRLPEILDRVVAENEYPTRIRENLLTLKGEIPEGPIHHLRDDSGPDLESWRKYISPWVGKDWLNVPWFFVEHYFYRRILSAVDYFQTGQDPFLHQKQQGFWQSQEAIRAYGKTLDHWSRTDVSGPRMLREGILRSLWGNQADLSLWPAGSEKSPDHQDLQALKSHLLADQSAEIIRLLSRRSAASNRLALLLDNAGMELVSDLALVDILLGQRLADHISLWVKAHPTFVSDVISADVTWMIKALQESAAEPTKKLGERLAGYLQEGLLTIQDHFFWNSPLAMWDLPGDLLRELSQLTLLISKGDANYRRLLGDRQWDITEHFADVVDYCPVPLAALRALKAELVIGLSLDEVVQIHNQDPRWMVNGKWAVIHYAPGSGTRASREYT